jgi:hypothetical protein
MMADTVDPGLERVMYDEIVDTCDTILLGRKKADGFVKYWEQEAITGTGKAREFGIKAVRMQKIMFSRTVRHAESNSLKVENGPLVDTVNALKRQSSNCRRIFNARTNLELSASRAYPSGTLVNTYVMKQ